MAGDGSGRSVNRFTGRFNEGVIDGLYTMTEKYIRKEFGKCYEFQFHKKLADYGINIVEFISHEFRTLLLSIHHPGQFRNEPGETTDTKLTITK